MYAREPESNAKQSELSKLMSNIDNSRALPTAGDALGGDDVRARYRAKVREDNAGLARKFLSLRYIRKCAAVG